MKIPKMPKINKPAKGLPIKGLPLKMPAINNKFLKKNLFSLIVIAVMLIGTGTAYGTLSTRDADRGADPVNGVNEDRYQVLVSGEGYKLSKQQEKDYKLQKKQNEANATKALQAAQSNPVTFRTSSGSRVFRTSSYNYRRSTYTVSKAPRVTTDISSEISKAKDGGKLKAGKKLEFTISALAYPYGTKNKISPDNIKIKVTGDSKVTLDEDGEGKLYNHYILTVGSEKSKITITVTDKKRKKTTKLGPYTVKPEGSTSNSSGKKPDNGNNSGGTPSDDNQGGDNTDSNTKEYTITTGYNPIPAKLDVDDTTTVADVLNAAGIEVDVDNDKVIKVPVDFSSAVDEIKDNDNLKNKYKQDNPEDVDMNGYNNWIDELKKQIQNNYEFDDDIPIEVSWKCNYPLTTPVKNATEISLEVKLKVE